MDSLCRSDSKQSRVKFQKSSFFLPPSQVVKSQSTCIRRPAQLVDKNTNPYTHNLPIIPSAPSNLNTRHNQSTALLESHKKNLLFSGKPESKTYSPANAGDKPDDKKPCQNILSDKSSASRGSVVIEHPKLSKASFDMQLSQVIRSQMFKTFRRPSSVQNPPSIEAANQYTDVPPPPSKRIQEDLLAANDSQHARGQWIENEPFMKIGANAIVENVRSQYVEDDAYKTADNPCVGGIQLRSVKEIPRVYQDIFNFPYFNILQSVVLDEVLYTDKSIVVSAPTGSGKTVIFELALIRLLMKMESSGHQGKIVYMAPMKALCTERHQDWALKFSKHGLSCLEITGDSELVDFGELLKADLICTTPEKWDSVSRRWKDNKSLFHEIQLFLIDEIHILNDPNRGATVEAVVSRMKTLQTANSSAGGNHIHFVAVSATMPNYNDIAEWLGTSCKPATAFNLGENFRPVKLDRIVLGYPFKQGTSDFRFDMNLSYRLRAIIETYSHGRPTLVFCSSRKSVTQTAEALARDLRTRTLNVNYRTDFLQKAANSVHEHKLSDLLLMGIGMHHAGIDTRDRHIVEELFRTSQLPVLISTSTLAMGVNLPAHLVIIKSTHFYNMGVVQEYSDMQILQMIGRAGRPQFDTSATAVIMTKAALKRKYESLVNGTQLIESSLHKNLIEYLNAEIVLQTISEMSLVVEWLRQTFLYVRVMKNPKYYGLDSNLSASEMEKRLQDLCQKSLTLLSSLNLVSIDEETSSIFPTSTGRLMSRYCIAYETMKQFHNIGDEQGSIAGMLTVMSQCTEFEDILLRMSEKKILNSFNRDKNRETIRFPLTGKIKTTQMKVNCLIQAQLSCLPVQDFSLSQDMAKIFRVGQRIAKCLVELMYQRSSYCVFLNAILIYKAFKCKLWFDSVYVARQLDGIGPTMSLALANSGFTSFQKLEQASPREIELIVNRHPPFGNQIKEAVSALPRYKLTIDQMKCYKPNKAVLKLRVDLLNRSIIEEVPSSHNSHQSLLIVGDAENNLIFKWRIMDATILREGVLSQTLEVKRSPLGTSLSISLLSQDWVGLDIYMDYVPVYSEGWFEPAKLPLNLKAQTPASKLSQAIQLAKITNPLKNSVLPVTPVEKSLGKCNHKCNDKTLCGHKCCKVNSNKRIPPTTVESPCTKWARREGSVRRENQDIKEIVHIVEQNNLLKNKAVPSLTPRISLTRGQGLNLMTSGKPIAPITPKPVARISGLYATDGETSYTASNYCSNPEVTDDFVVNRLNPNIRRLNQPGQIAPIQEGGYDLDSSVNGWSDLDVFQMSRQSLFVNGRPEHLQENEDELSSMSGSPEVDFATVDDGVDEGVEDKLEDFVWTTTTSSDEELCQFVDTSTIATANEKLMLEPFCQNREPYEMRPFNKTENYFEIQNNLLELDVELGTDFELNTFRSHDLKNNNSPAVITINDSDSIISVSSSDNQTGVLNLQNNCSPFQNSGKLSQSVTPTLKTNKETLLKVSHNKLSDALIFSSGSSDHINNTSHDSIDKTSYPVYHRYGHVQAWKKDTHSAKTSGAHESATKPANGMSLFFVPRKRISSQETQVTTNLFEGIF